MASTLRDTYAEQLDESRVGDEVRLAGWVDRLRDHGGVTFIDLRDSSGIIQVVANPAELPIVGDLRNEFCVAVVGAVRPRPQGTVNPDLPTGGVEVAAEELTVLSPADPLPFVPGTGVEERLRLEYRYLDLRSRRMASNLRARSAGMAAIRSVLGGQGFLEVETPTLIASTPEGARDLLVPSRLQKGSFYALPQSPQLFKQLLMIGGVDRYYQIARCYRDEDFRSDRQVEFTQLDLEGAFWDRDDVLETLESVVFEVVRAIRGDEVGRPFRRLTYAEAMSRYGTDKPDLRFGMEIEDVSVLFEGTEFRGFSAALEEGGVVRGLNAGVLQYSRSQLDALVEEARKLGAKGLVWAVVEENGELRSPVAKFLSTEEHRGLKDAFKTEAGDVLLLVADATPVAAEVLGALRLALGRPDGHEELVFAWVVEFPVFDVTPEGKLVPSHHPFTSPVSVEEMKNDPSNAIARAYDLVLNGSELGSGSVRIHDSEVQRQVFEVLGIGEAEADARFGWFLRALRYGTPPHAGFAVGLDRLFAILQGESSIREIIPFPKTQTGNDPLTGSPAPVPDEQLRELGIQLRKPPK